MLDLLMKGAVLVAGGAFALLGNGVIRWLLRRIDQVARRVEDDLEQTRRNLGLVAAQQELPGGRWVGILERIAIYCCLVAGFPEGIAIVLAVKGLGRYADLKTTSASGTSRKGELFIIGTFASVLWAALWAGIAYGVVRLW
ncbi:hypothetical protein ACX1DX_07555 [Tessaracoccus sp. Y36]|uniref:hypothetical protein n=1 Tax=Tessaracoccus sp. ZS01 TaxID=1906324 RepID=UPI0018EA2000|nr:hypothetical protein [Tessaracoccus sp. ZS01]